jgi:hypothetical protein
MIMKWSDKPAWIAMTFSLNLLVSGSAIASDQDGSVSWYAADITTSPYAFLVLGARTPKPACATDDAWAIINPTTDGSKALLAGIMTARVGNRAVQVRGSGICDPAAPMREAVQYILFY